MTTSGSNIDRTVFGIVNKNSAITSKGASTTMFMAGDDAGSTPVVVDGKAADDTAEGAYPTRATATLGNAQMGDDIKIGGDASGSAANGQQSSYDATCGVLTLTGSGKGRQTTFGTDGSDATVSLAQPDGRWITDIVGPGPMVDLDLYDMASGHRRIDDTLAFMPCGETRPSTRCSASRRAGRTATC